MLLVYWSLKGSLLKGNKEENSLDIKPTLGKISLICSVWFNAYFYEGSPIHTISMDCFLVECIDLLTQLWTTGLKIFQNHFKEHKDAEGFDCVYERVCP